MAHGNDLGGSIRYPARRVRAVRAQTDAGTHHLGPEYGDVVSGWAVEFAVTRSVRDAAALLDALAGPSRGRSRTRAPTAGSTRSRDEVGPPSPVGCGSAALRARPTARPDTPTASPRSTRRSRRWPTRPRRRRDRAPAVRRGDRRRDRHRLQRRDGVDRRVLDAVLGRGPEPGELEPLTQCYWEMGREVTRRRLPARDRGAAAPLTADRRVLDDVRRVREPDDVGAARRRSARSRRPPTIRCVRSSAAVAPSRTRESSPTSPATRDVGARGAGARPASPWACTCSAASVTKRRSCSSRVNWSGHDRGTTSHLPSPRVRSPDGASTRPRRPPW